MVTVCEWFGLKTTRAVFASLASKLVVTVSGGLASKPAATVSGALASKPAAMVSSGLASKPAAAVFSGLALKLVAMVFSSLASKLVATFFSSLTSKLVATVSPGLASKPVVGFLVEPENQGDGGFPGLGLKITATVSWFGPQNQVGFDLSVFRLLCVEASLARVSQSGLMTSGGTTAGGACGTITEVVSEAS
jgi:hypothetical protein